MKEVRIHYEYFTVASTLTIHCAIHLFMYTIPFLVQPSPGTHVEYIGDLITGKMLETLQSKAKGLKVCVQIHF